MEAARPAGTAEVAADDTAMQEAVLTRVGQMTRSLHDSLRVLDFDKLEQQLVQLLVHHAPGDMRREANAGLLNGPQINPNAGPDVMADQTQVDDLVESPGF